MATSQNALDCLIAKPASAALPANHLVYLTGAGAVALLGTAQIAQRVGVAVNEAFAAGEMVSFIPRGAGVYADIVASAPCTTGATVVVTTNGQVADGTGANVVGVCLKGCAAGEYAEVLIN